MSARKWITLRSLRTAESAEAAIEFCRQRNALYLAQAIERCVRDEAVRLARYPKRKWSRDHALYLAQEYYARDIGLHLEAKKRLSGSAVLNNARLAYAWAIARELERAGRLYNVRRRASKAGAP